VAGKRIDEVVGGKYGTPLQQYHRDAILDLVLAWASLDGALTMLVSAHTGEELPEAARRLAKLKGTAKLLEIAGVFDEDEQGTKIARKFRKLKKRYEKHSKPRNRIAHAHCAGYLLSDEQYLVFAVAEPEGEDGMAIEAIPVEIVHAATEFEKSLTTFALQTVDKIWANKPS